MQNDWDMPAMSQCGVRCCGHEGAGVVVKLGANVKNWKIGDRGGVKPVWSTCGKCEQCWTGQENYCQNVNITGLTANGMLVGEREQGVANDAKGHISNISPRLRTTRAPYQTEWMIMWQVPLCVAHPRCTERF